MMSEFPNRSCSLPRGKKVRLDISDVLSLVNERHTTSLHSPEKGSKICKLGQNKTATPDRSTRQDALVNTLSQEAIEEDVCIQSSLPSYFDHVFGVCIGSSQSTQHNPLHAGHQSLHIEYEQPPVDLVESQRFADKEIDVPKMNDEENKDSLQLSPVLFPSSILASQASSTPDYTASHVPPSSQVTNTSGCAVPPVCLPFHVTNTSNCATSTVLPPSQVSNAPDCAVFSELPPSQVTNTLNCTNPPMLTSSQVANTPNYAVAPVRSPPQVTNTPDSVPLATRCVPTSSSAVSNRKKSVSVRRRGFIKVPQNRKRKRSPSKEKYKYPPSCAPLLDCKPAKVDSIVHLFALVLQGTIPVLCL